MIVINIFILIVFIYEILNMKFDNYDMLSLWISFYMEL